MRAKSKSKKQKNKLRIFLIFFIGLAVIIFFMLNHQIKLKLRDIAVYKCENNATDMINTAIQDTLNDESYTYNDLVEINKNSDNQITSVSCVSSNINKLKSQISDEINKGFEDREKNSFDISVGTIAGINFFSGIGPDITIHFEKEGSVKTNIKSSFKSSGINQTLHQIYIYVSADILAVTSSGTYKSNVKTEFLLAETVIVGEIPERYASIS